jgi:hypothetical protein
MANMAASTRFLNVDLDLAGPVDLAPLLAALARTTVVLRHEVGAEGEIASLELLRGPATVEEALRGFAAIVRRLPRPARAAWEQLTTRALDVGVQPGAEPHMFQLAASAEALAGIAEVGMALVVTVYGVDESSV